MYSHVDCNTAEKLRAANGRMFRCDDVNRSVDAFRTLGTYFELLDFAHAVHLCHVVTGAIDAILFTGCIDLQCLQAGNGRILGSIVLHVVRDRHPTRSELSL